MFLIDVIDVSPIENRTLQLTFADGLQAVINMDEIIKSYTVVLLQNCQRMPIFGRFVSVLI